MLTKKQNLRETIHGGNPDRLVNQYEYMQMVFDPITAGMMGDLKPGGSVVNGWGVTVRWPENVPGPFPDHSEEKKVLKDLANWKNVVKAPNIQYPEEAWAPFVQMAEAVDRNEVFVAPMVAPGIFEKLHYLMGMEDTLIGFYEEPEAMHELIEFLGDWEIECAKEVIRHLHPDAILHHDDWGSQKSSFISPEMFEEFLVPVYKRVYGFWKENGVELIVHHSDSYGENLVPHMIEMGIDIWQGAMSTNNIPEILKNYGGKIALHGGIDNGRVDRPDWTLELAAAETRACIERCGCKYFIPGLVAGGPGSTFPGVYEAVSAEIEKISREMFG